MKKKILRYLLVSVIILCSVVFAQAATIWTTDVDGNPVFDYSPGSIVYIHGSGFNANDVIDMAITRPNGLIEYGTGNSDGFGNFIYEYPIGDINVYGYEGTVGNYSALANDGTNSAEVVFSDYLSWVRLDYPNGGTVSGTINIQFYANKVGVLNEYVYAYYSKTGCNPSSSGWYYIGRMWVTGDGTYYIAWDTTADADGSNYCIVVIDQGYIDGSDWDKSDNAFSVNNGPTQVCGNNILEGNEQCDGGVCCNADCTFKSSADVCRAANGDCDVAEYCTGSSSLCPGNSYLPEGTSCNDDLFCNVGETCDGFGNCYGGNTRDCSDNDLPIIDECTYSPDNNPYTWDSALGFTSKCDESNDECTQGSYSFNHECNVPLCNAECDTKHSCLDNSCSETYNDYCDNNKLVEYDNNRIMDSTYITDSCPNSCQSSCECTDCGVDCSAPLTNSYCVKDVCGAECEQDSDCGVCKKCSGCRCEWDLTYPDENPGTSGSTVSYNGNNVVTANVGSGIPLGIGVGNACPEIINSTYYVNINSDLEKICSCDPARTECVERINNFFLNKGIVGRSYSFEGETVNFQVIVKDQDGIIQDCVKVYVTLDNGNDPIEAACVLDHTEYLINEEVCSLISREGIGYYNCQYTTEPAESGTTGEYWISVMVADGCGNGCSDNAPGAVSLYLNPAVGLSIESQDEFGFVYDENGDTAWPSAGSIVYSPYFKVENSADEVSGLYILLQIYGTDMWDYSSSAALCPTTNKLGIENVQYKASHLNVQQNWEVMPKNYAGKKFVFQSPMNFGGNFLGVGDDVTMRLRLNIPSPCNGDFQDGGQIVFVGQVI